QLAKLKAKYDTARDERKAALLKQFPLDTPIVVVYTPEGGKAYRADDAPDGAKIIARGRVVGVDWSRGAPDVRVHVDDVTPVMAVETAPGADEECASCDINEPACHEGTCDCCERGHKPA